MLMSQISAAWQLYLFYVALIGIGIAFGLALVLIKSPSPMLIAVGMYLHLDTTAAIFVGGILAWLVSRIIKRLSYGTEERLATENKGTLVASGLIAGEALMAVALAALYFLLLVITRELGKGDLQMVRTVVARRKRT